MKKYKINGLINNKRVSYSRDTIDSARGLSENFTRASIYKNVEGKWIKIDEYKNNKFKGITIENELKIARLKALQK